MRATEWTADQDATIRTRRLAGATYDEIADAVGSSRTTVRRRCDALGLPPPFTWTPERDRVLAERRDEGVPVEKVAAELGCGEKAVYARYKALDLDISRPRVEWTPDRDRVITEMILAGKPAGEVADSLGLSCVSVNLRRRALGLPVMRSKFSGGGERYGLPRTMSGEQVRVLLALTGGPLLATDISRQAGDPHEHVVKRLDYLKKLGYVFSVRSGVKLYHLYALTLRTITLLENAPDADPGTD
jgi:biotin operon repressor